MAAMKPNLVVAQDGSGDYKTISQAVAAAQNQRISSNGSISNTAVATRFVIHVKAGFYYEQIQIPATLTNLMIIGDGMDKSVVTGNKDHTAGSLTKSATFAVFGNGFIAQDMGFENTAGPEKGQAVAFVSKSKYSVLYRCSFKGYQDTLFLHSDIQFYTNCHIYGTIDFICGDATAVLQGCTIIARKPSQGQGNVVTAQSRDDNKSTTGFVIQDSVVEAAPELKPVLGSVHTYLGRPWRDYSRTVFMNTYLGDLIDPEGWSKWNPKTKLDALYYAEYNNKGPGASTAGRVKWPGYHILTTQEAQKFTVANFLSGDSWIPATGIPYKSGL